MTKVKLYRDGIMDGRAGDVIDTDSVTATRLVMAGHALHVSDKDVEFPEHLASRVEAAGSLPQDDPDKGKRGAPKKPAAGEKAPAGPGAPPKVPEE